VTCGVESYMGALEEGAKADCGGEGQGGMTGGQGGGGEEGGVPEDEQGGACLRSTNIVCC